jgi:hypothetical protein
LPKTLNNGKVFRWQFLCRQHGFVKFDEAVCTACRDEGIWKSRPLNSKYDLKLIRRIYMEQTAWVGYFNGLGCGTLERKISICCSKHYNESTFCKVWIKEMPEDDSYLLGYWCSRCKYLETFNKKNFRAEPMEQCMTCHVKISKPNSCIMRTPDLVMEFALVDDYSWETLLNVNDDQSSAETIKR